MSDAPIPSPDEIPGGDTTVVAQNGAVQLIAERYEIVDEIGKGGMGIVYLALDRKLNRYVALKRLITQTQDGQIVERRFMREAQTIASLGHANIVNVYDIVKDVTGLFIVMEYVSGPVMQERHSAMRPPPPMTVEQYVKLEGTFSSEDCRKLLSRLALALDYAHQEGVIHRDVKPANILLNGQFEPKLVDFGLAMPMEKMESMELTREGSLLGTPDYAAPEQWTDAGSADGRADLYSLAASAWYMLTAESPRYFREKSLPNDLKEPLCQAMEKDRDARQESAQAFHDQLEVITEHGQPVDFDYDDRTIAGPASGIWVCIGCGAQNLEADDYCRGCGDQGSRDCEVCGSVIPGGSKFCSKCGSDVGSTELTAGVLERARAQAEAHEYEAALVSLREIPGEVSGAPGREVREWRQATLKRRHMLTDLETTLRSCNYARAAEIFGEVGPSIPTECLSDSADFVVVTRYQEIEEALKVGLLDEVDRARAERNYARFKHYVEVYDQVAGDARAKKMLQELKEVSAMVKKAISKAGIAVGFNCISRALADLHTVPPWRGGDLGDKRERLEANLAGKLSARERTLDEIEELMGRGAFDQALRCLMNMNDFRLPLKMRDLEPDPADIRVSERLNELDKQLSDELTAIAAGWMQKDRWDEIAAVKDLTSLSEERNWKKLGDSLLKICKQEGVRRFEAAVAYEQKERFRLAAKAWNSVNALPKIFKPDRATKMAEEFGERRERYERLRGRAQCRRMAVVLLLLWGYPLAKSIGHLGMTIAGGDQLTREMIICLWPQPAQFLLFVVFALVAFFAKDSSDARYRYLPHVSRRGLFLGVAAALSPASMMVTDFSVQWLPHAGISMDVAVLGLLVPTFIWFFSDLSTGNRLRPPAGAALTLAWLLSAGVLFLGVQVESYLQWLAVGGAQAGCFLLIHLIHKLVVPFGRDGEEDDEGTEDVEAS